jgi:putative membrane protein
MSTKLRIYYPHILAVLFGTVFIILGIDPADRKVWVAEVIPIVTVFVLLVVTFRRFRFSNYSYTMMSLWMFWHTVGAHYTFANVPFDFVTDLFGFERNHFDRIGHFIVGFYAFAVAELAIRRGWAKPFWAILSGIFLIGMVAAAYEIVEWIFAVVDGGDAGIEFLGAQGDVWDAQKDMLADILGAIFASVLYGLIRPDKTIIKKYMPFR